MGTFLGTFLVLLGCLGRPGDQDWIFLVFLTLWGEILGPIWDPLGALLGDFWCLFLMLFSNMICVMIVLEFSLILESVLGHFFELFLNLLIL